MPSLETFSSSIILEVNSRFWPTKMQRIEIINIQNLGHDLSNTNVSHNYESTEQTVCRLSVCFFNFPKKHSKKTTKTSFKVQYDVNRVVGIFNIFGHQTFDLSVFIHSLISHEFFISLVNFNVCVFFKIMKWGDCS